MSNTRLELVWPGKDQFLLIPKDNDGQPVWVDRSHPAAHEIRLADFTGAVGEVDHADPYRDNLLFTGDCLDAMRILGEVPEYRRHYRGRVKLIYLDSPFNTGGVWEHYADYLDHSTWLSFMRDRLAVMKPLLADDGTVWVHLDNYEVHRMRLVLDELFGGDNYLGTVIWQRTSAKSLARKTMGTMHESILVYGATIRSELNQLFLPLEDAYVAKRYTNEDERGRYDTGDLTATSYRPHLDSGQPWRGFDPSSRRRCWAVSTGPLLDAGFTDEVLASMTMREKLDALDAQGFIHWPKDDGFPRFKKYLSRAKGRAVGDLWTDISVINSQAVERSGYSTQKPEALLMRVIEMATEPGDIVLDGFAGSGTTAAVAHKMRRRWVTSELSGVNVDEFTRPRLESVVNGTDTGGITSTVRWTGGGGFRTVQVAKSLYALTPLGVMLTDDAHGQRFARAMAGQLGFDWEPDAAPFCGRRGRMRLAVFDGAVGVEEATQVVSALEPTERVTIVAQVVLPGVEELLVETSRGSRARKAPRDVLTERRRPRRRATS